MKIKGNRFVTSILAASMLSGTFFVPASAGELEGESAIAGMAVTLNNYYEIGRASCRERVSSPV